MNHLLHSTDLFECYCWQNYTRVSNTDLYLSYFNLSYVVPEHNDSVEWCLTVIYIFLVIKLETIKLKWHTTLSLLYSSSHSKIYKWGSFSFLNSTLCSTIHLYSIAWIRISSGPMTLIVCSHNEYTIWLEITYILRIWTSLENTFKHQIHNKNWENCGKI